jgi:PUA domain protein
VCLKLFAQYEGIRFSPSTDIATQARLKSSVQRGIRTSLCNQIPLLGENNGALLEAIWSKKDVVVHVKWSAPRSHQLVILRSSVLLLVFVRSREHLSIYTLNGEPLFFQHFDGPYFPTLKLLHKCKCFKRHALHLYVHLISRSRS